MGGIGSGRFYRQNRNTTVDESKSIDIRFMRRQKLLKDGTSGKLSWQTQGQPSGNINFSCWSDRLTLSYRCRLSGDNWQNITQTIFFNTTSCNYGGERTWFSCPNCQRRCEILLGVSLLFECRKCSKTLYYSQTKNTTDRLVDQQQKIKNKIFEDNILKRKKGMHKKTFRKLIEKYYQLEKLIDDDFCKRFAKHIYR